jgi:hypothetical protein
LLVVASIVAHYAFGAPPQRPVTDTSAFATCP